MKPRLVLFIPLFLFSFLAFSADKVESGRPEVDATMRGTFAALMELQPYLAQQTKFSDPANKDEILGKLAALSAVKHVFPKKMNSEEPGLSVIATLFGDYLADAERNFKQGAYEYSRQRVRAITGFCFACHSRLGSEKVFEDSSKRIDESDLTSREKAEFFAATRQFDKALAQYDKVLDKAPDGELGYIEFTRGVRQALRVTVGAKNDPDATLHFLDKLSKRPGLSQSVKGDIESWRRDAQLWKNEKFDPKKLSAAALIKKAKSLVDRGLKAQAFPADEQGDISFLRATALLHLALEKNARHESRGEALYLLGVCSHALQDSLLWELDTLYWESCVREYPKTALATRCFKRYSEKILLGYTGSAGTQLPESELKKLTELRALTGK